MRICGISSGFKRNDIRALIATLSISTMAAAFASNAAFGL